MIHKKGSNKCEHCGTIFRITPSQQKARHCCSRACHTELAISKRREKYPRLEKCDPVDIDKEIQIKELMDGAGKIYKLYQVLVLRINNSSGIVRLSTLCRDSRVNAITKQETRVSAALRTLQRAGVISDCKDPGFYQKVGAQQTSGLYNTHKIIIDSGVRCVLN